MRERSPTDASAPIDTRSPITTSAPIAAPAPIVTNAPISALGAISAVGSISADGCTPGDTGSSPARMRATLAYTAYGLDDTSFGSGVRSAASGATITAEARVSRNCGR